MSTNLELLGTLSVIHFWYRTVQQQLSEPAMILCLDSTARPPGQEMYHTALASFTNMHPEKHLCVPHYLPALFSNKSASNVHETKSQKLLHQRQYFYERTKYPKT
jgi:hypothetical protein